MERQTILEFMRMVLIAFVIAFVINIFRVLIFTSWDNEPRFENITQPEPEPVQVQNNNIESQHINNAASEPTVNTNLSNETINISIAPLENLSGLSKSRILEKRINAMRTSEIFSEMNYIPSSDVYRITDGLPWISANAALHWSEVSEREKYDGPSRDSLGILNPELLYYIQIFDYYKKVDDYEYLYKNYNVIPYKVIYNISTKTITAYIKNERNPEGDYLPITIADANAHDLGYKYAYMSDTKNIGYFSDEPYKSNKFTDIKEITGYYMHGSVCGISGGCNNYAPYWQYYNHFYLRRLPASFNIKLWKQRPSSVNQEADINFEMIFE